jgi:hypothetical protein
MADAWLASDMERERLGLTKAETELGVRISCRFECASASDFCEGGRLLLR